MSINPAYVPRLEGSDTGIGVTGEAADMHLIDDRFREWLSGRRVSFPIVGVGSTTTLFKAVAVFEPGRRASPGYSAAAGRYIYHKGLAAPFPGRTAGP